MSDIDTAAADSLKVLDPKRPIREADIGFAIGSIMRLQVPRVRMENGWALGKCAGDFAQARGLTLGSSNLVYFCKPTLRTQLHMSVCGPRSRHEPVFPPRGPVANSRTAASKPKPTIGLGAAVTAVASSSEQR